MDGCKPLLEGHTDAVRTCAYSPGGSRQGLTHEIISFRDILGGFIGFQGQERLRLNGEVDERKPPTLVHFSA